MADDSTILDEPFDPATEEATPARHLLPNGKYRAEVIDASVSETKNGRGTLLNLTWQILDPGEFDHRHVYQSILVRHESADAQRYGRFKLKDLCDACGVTDAVTDVTVFRNKPCTISVGIERDKDGVYADKNRVNGISQAVSTRMPPPPLAGAAAPNGKPANKPPFSDEVPF